MFYHSVFICISIILITTHGWHEIEPYESSSSTNQFMNAGCERKYPNKIIKIYANELSSYLNTNTNEKFTIKSGDTSISCSSSLNFMPTLQLQYNSSVTPILISNTSIIVQASMNTDTLHNYLKHTNMSLPLSTIYSTSVAGYVLLGGFDWNFARYFGYGMDLIKSANITLTNGTRMNTYDRKELVHYLRGSSQLGIVTHLELMLATRPTHVVNVVIKYDLDEIQNVVDVAQTMLYNVSSSFSSIQVVLSSACSEQLLFICNYIGTEVELNQTNVLSLLLKLPYESITYTNKAFDDASQPRRNISSSVGFRMASIYINHDQYIDETITSYLKRDHEQHMFRVLYPHCRPGDFWSTTIHVLGGRLHSNSYQNTISNSKSSKLFIVFESQWSAENDDNVSQQSLRAASDTWIEHMIGTRFHTHSNGSLPAFQDDYLDEKIAGNHMYYNTHDLAMLKEMKSSYDTSLQLQSPTPLVSHVENNTTNVILTYLPSYEAPLLASNVLDDFIREGGATHLIWAFIDVDWNEHDQSFTAKVQNDHGRAYFTSLFKDIAIRMDSNAPKLLVSVGGRTSSALDSMWALALQYPHKFAEALQIFLDSHGDIIHGVDIDFEFPTAAQTHAFTNLLQTIRDYIGNDRILSVAVGPIDLDFDLGWGYNASAITNIVDFMSVMAYDMHTPRLTETTTPILSPTSPFYRIDDSIYAFSTQRTIKAWVKQGAKRNKILLGIPLYAVEFKVSNYLCTTASNNAAIEPVGMTPQSTDVTFGTYYDAFSCNQYRIHRYKKTAHLTSFSLRCEGELATIYTFLSRYDVAMRSEYVVHEGLRGIMAWQLTQGLKQPNNASENLLTPVRDIFFNRNRAKSSSSYELDTCVKRIIETNPSLPWLIPLLIGFSGAILYMLTFYYIFHELLDIKMNAYFWKCTIMVTISVVLYLLIYLLSNEAIFILLFVNILMILLYIVIVGSSACLYHRQHRQETNTLIQGGATVSFSDDSNNERLLVVVAAYDESMENLKLLLKGLEKQSYNSILMDVLIVVDGDYKCFNNLTSILDIRQSNSHDLIPTARPVISWYNGERCFIGKHWCTITHGIYNNSLEVHIKYVVKNQGKYRAQLEGISTYDLNLYSSVLLLDSDTQLSQDAIAIMQNELKTKPISLITGCATPQVRQSSSSFSFPKHILQCFQEADFKLQQQFRKASEGYYNYVGCVAGCITMCSSSLLKHSSAVRQSYDEDLSKGFYPNDIRRIPLRMSSLGGTGNSSRVLSLNDTETLTSSKNHRCHGCVPPILSRVLRELGEDRFLTTCTLHHLGNAVAYASSAIAYTDIPLSFKQLLKQRNRWVKSYWSNSWCMISMMLRVTPTVSIPFFLDFIWSTTPHLAWTMVISLIVYIITQGYTLITFVAIGLVVLLLLVAAFFIDNIMDMYKFTIYITIMPIFSLLISTAAILSLPQVKWGTRDQVKTYADIDEFDVDVELSTSLQPSDVKPNNSLIVEDTTTTSVSMNMRLMSSTNSISTSMNDASQSIIIDNNSSSH